MTDAIDQLTIVIILGIKKIMSTQAEAVLALTAINEQLAKIGQETSATLAKVAELQALIDAGATVTPELQAAIDAVKASAQKVDELVPDAPVVTA